ncbi:MAG: hypothetical protein U1A27_04635 [Phycisphaerae bacterium]
MLPISVPKAGTNLLEAMLRAVPGLRVIDVLIPPDQWQAEKSYAAEPSDGPRVPVDVDLPHLVPLATIDALFARLSPGESFKCSHVMFSAPMGELVARHGLRTILMLRDPRDVVVSQVHYTLREPGNPLHHYFANGLATFEERLSACITGTPGRIMGSAFQHVSIAQRFAAVRGWMAQPYNLTLRFRDLVGPAGGGSEAAQRDAARAVCDHLGVSVDQATVDAIAAQTFRTDSPTFRRGQIGAWRESFTPEHREIFKEVAGQTLIELGFERDFDW